MPEILRGHANVRAQCADEAGEGERDADQVREDALQIPATDVIVVLVVFRAILDGTSVYVRLTYGFEHLRTYI